ncbi:MarR family winged helix-turn-helix transcriptional regulator [Nocardia sp. BMG111209]|uniref:MarR family winged helix-turn-helix transcriptional regulator n=1 Tax=Nocardia sp. BMG111209 TaxID=1160137 RepID=UPI0012DD89AF|nr:MarR family transcriptional regulator [Nocardia sp. BMG111209]
MTPSPEPTAALLLYLVKRLELATRSQLDAVLKPSGVTALQYTALTVLERRRTMSAADLARASFVRAQSTSDLVSALERHGLIERSADPANRRRLVISLTAQGHAFLAEYNPLVAQLEERMLVGFDAADRDRFREYLVAGRRALTGDRRA